MKVSTTPRNFVLWKSARTMVLLEFKPADLWIGAFWKRATLHTLTMSDGGDMATPTFDVWICLLPMVPIHICRWGVSEPRPALRMAKA